VENGENEIQTICSAISKYLALQYSGTGIEHQLAVRRNDEIIVKKLSKSNCKKYCTLQAGVTEQPALYFLEVEILELKGIHLKQRFSGPN